MYTSKFIIINETFILAVCLLALASRAGSQSVINGNFESGDSSNWRFTSPATFGNAKEAGYKFSIIKDSVKGKSYVARFTNTGNGQWCQISQRFRYKASDSLEKLRLSSNIKLKGVNSGTAGISIRLFSAGKSVGYFEKSLGGDTGWIKISTEFLVNNRVDSLAVFCSIKGSGEVSFDDVQLEKIRTAKIEQSPKARVYLDTAFNIIQEQRSIKIPLIKKLVEYANLLAADAKEPADCYGAIEYVLSGLQDKHSHFRTPEQVRYISRGSDNIMEFPGGKTISPSIGYLKVPKCIAISPELEKKFADSLQHIIRSIDGKNISGWIVDVRDNTGGNVFPMLLGLGPILGDGVFQRTIKNGKTVDSMGYWAGVLRNNDSILSKTTSPYILLMPFPKVALLMNGLSASSGESVILSFKGRPGTKLFGQPSYGLTTGNADFIMSDGAMIFVCTSKQTDRFGNAYGGKIYPDELVSNGSSGKDEVMEMAVKWLIQK